MAFRITRLHQGLLGGFLLVWAVLAIDPVDRRDWLLENILTVVTVGVLLWTYRRFPLADASYVLIAVFLILHAVGAHYTYAKVPLGFWLKDLFELSRNHFDRIVHFGFGLLFAYPIREILVRWAKVTSGWSYVLTVLTIMACSDFFEVLESWVAQIVSPELGTAYLGTQGDVWDAQKDTTCALVGALLAVLCMLVLPRIVPKRFHLPNLKPA